MASAEAVPSTSAALSRRTRPSLEHFRCREGSSTPHIWLIPGTAAYVAGGTGPYALRVRWVR